MFEEKDNDFGENQYDYSQLNSRYEANVERNEIIEWNKYEDNAQYDNLERIAEELNFKEMQLENCRKGYSDLLKENEQLKKRNDRQAKQLGNIYKLIEEKDWRALSDIIDDFKRCDEQLKREWRCYE